MRTGIWVAVATLVGFVVGAGVHRWSNQAVEVKAPTSGLLNEFAPTPDTAPLRLSLSPGDAARLTRQMEKMHQDSASFRTELNEMERAYRQRVMALLKPEQREKLEGAGVKAQTMLQPGIAKQSGGSPGDVLIAAPMPGGDALTPAIPGLSSETLHTIFELTFVSWSLENLRTELGLDTQQVDDIRSILVERRERFLQLVDRFPPPTLRLLNVGRELDRRVKASPGEP